MNYPLAPDELQNLSPAQQQGWLEVHRQLRAAPLLAPAPGFTGRWQANLAVRRARLHRQQTLGLLIGGFSALLLILALLVFLRVSSFSAAASLLVITQSLVGWVEWMNVLRSALQVWFRLVPLSVILFLWYTTLLSLALISVGWGITLWRIHPVGGHQL